MMQIKIRFWIFLALFLWSFGAVAQTIGLYAVKDVASNDSLNVRSIADVGHRISLVDRLNQSHGKRAVCGGRLL
ncbi:MAG: hypothetical protein V7761_13720 [Amylibacter sp.]